jgi:hypothetical protein
LRVGASNTIRFGDLHGERIALNFRQVGVNPVAGLRTPR